MIQVFNSQRKYEITKDCTMLWKTNFVIIKECSDCELTSNNSKVEKWHHRELNNNFLECLNDEDIVRHSKFGQVSNKTEIPLWELIFTAGIGIYSVFIAKLGEQPKQYYTLQFKIFVITARMFNL